MKFVKLIIVGSFFLALASCYGSPFEKPLAHDESATNHLEPEQDKVKLIIIRPYDYSYYGHAVEVLINNISQVSIPNQSFSVLTPNPGVMEVHGQSGLLGPPSRDIRIEGNAGEVVYLLWKTTTTPNYTSVIPIIGLHWEKVSKEEADVYLKNVKYIQPQNAGKN